MKLRIASDLSLPTEAVTEKEKKLAKQRERARKWRVRNREKLLEYFREYRKKRGQELVEYHARYYKQHPEKWKEQSRRPDVKEKRKARDAANADRIRKTYKAWRERNIERVREIERLRNIRNRPNKRESDRKWRSNNPEKYRSSIAAAKAANPELYRMIQRHSAAVRRSRKKSLPVEPVSLKRIFARDRMRCHLCGGHVETKETSIDHLIPVLRGGAFAEWNLMLAHLSCNKRRGTKHVLPQETREAAEAYLAQRVHGHKKEVRA